MDDAPYCSFCLESENELQWINLPCAHSYHQQCLLRWLHHGKSTCPLCLRQFAINKLFPSPMFKVYNISVSCQPSPEGLSLRPYGWFNVQLRVVPLTKGIKIRKISYYFHPAFSIPMVTMKRDPYDLLVKLCSSDVVVVISIVYKYKGVIQELNILHRLLKEPAMRVYIGDYFNGDEQSSEITSPETYFEPLLSLYQRPNDYYQQNNKQRQERRGWGLFKLFR
ncbi:hypothetical protein P9112_003300 [Eukaryota sp. TZLM1-RC]